MLRVTNAKTALHLAAMRDAAAIAIGVLEMMGAHVRPGVTTGPGEVAAWGSVPGDPGGALTARAGRLGG